MVEPGPPLGEPGTFVNAVYRPPHSVTTRSCMLGRLASAQSRPWIITRESVLWQHSTRTLGQLSELCRVLAFPLWCSSQYRASSCLSTEPGPPSISLMVRYTLAGVRMIPCWCDTAENCVLPRQIRTFPASCRASAHCRQGMWRERLLRRWECALIGRLTSNVFLTRRARTTQPMHGVV